MISELPKRSGSLHQIEQGELTHHGEKVCYEIVHGWDAKTSLDCDIIWKTSWRELLDEIEKREPDPTRQVEILKSISTEDIRWRWFDKAMAFQSDEYEWFHLHAEGKPQAACVIYHPKPSALESGKIFYVEFVAVAPWNRKCELRPRKFSSLGMIILRAAQRYAVTTLQLRPGFCLHSLPQAESFYTKLAMVKMPEKAKDSMNYFELPMSLAVKLMEAY